MDKIKPLPCPFCGCEYTKDEEDFVYAGQHEDWCPLNVKNNGLENLVVDDDPKAIEMWNRRKPDGYKILSFLHEVRDFLHKHPNKCLTGRTMDLILERIDKHHQSF